jgi:hypothetical protein
MKQVILVMIVLLFTVCQGENMNGTRFVLAAEINLSKQELQDLAGKKIYFGHQSVGFNIIDGIEDIMSIDNSGVKLNIKETRDPDDFDSPVFAHSGIGQNTEPVSKIDDFKKLMESGVGSKVDIAFFKFCYVDVNKDTNLKEVFKHYTDAISILETEYPQVKFVHCTAPLTVIQGGVKSSIKKILGKSRGEEDNMKRGIFNRMLKEKYGNRVFDLAGVESTYPDGAKAEFSENNDKFAYLVPEYSDDGGHLNKLGRQKVAGELIRFLGNN